MQAVYFLPKDSLKNPNIEQELLEIQAFRNDYQFWFNSLSPSKIKQISEQKINLQPVCQCGYHRAYSRNQIRQINDHQLTNQLAISFADIYKEYKTSKESASTIESNAACESTGSSPTNPLAKRIKRDESCKVMCIGGMGIISLVVIKLVPESTVYLHTQNKTCPFYKEIIYKERLEDKFLGVTD